LGVWLGGQDDAQSIAAIHRALDLGINWIDTAAVHGLGHSEEVVARALDGMAQRPYVFTKCSSVWNDQRQAGQSLKRDSLRWELEASLRRLRTDVIDLYQIHWPDPVADIEEGWATLVEFKREGKVRHIGVSNFKVEQMERIGAIAPVETLQPPYSLIDRESEVEILPYAHAHDIGVIESSA
jgi:aryl-alcohol dehydrogenase-like predicted oxidoreductase